MGLLIKYKWHFIAIITGMSFGYLYYYFIGCSSGSCPITSNPVNSMLYGGFMGALLPGIFQQKNSNPEQS